MTLICNSRNPGFDFWQNQKYFYTLVSPLGRQWQTNEGTFAKNTSLKKFRSESTLKYKSVYSMRITGI